MNTYLTIFLITAATGLGGLTLGSGLVVAVHSPSDRTVSILLRFAAGIMLSVVCFHLISDATEQLSSFSAAACIFLGGVLTYLLNRFIDRHANHCHTHTHGSYVEHHHHLHGGAHPHDLPAHDHHHGHQHGEKGDMCACGNHTMYRAGLLLAGAIALHNLPVGMVIGASFSAHSHTAIHGGTLTALMFGLHSIPEGMSIAAPLLSGGARGGKTIGITALCGLPTVLGALLGYSIGTMSPMLLSLTICVAAGAMLYVIFGELLPESEQLWQHRLACFATLFGILLGLALIGSSHIH